MHRQAPQWLQKNRPRLPPEAGETTPILGRGLIIHAASEDGGQPTDCADA
ncbi:MAG: hypothetical protein AAF329_22380 [Cyanobacteria bacterium P01_A01_bin.17]